MPPSIGYGNPGSTDPVEFSFEDAILNTWVEDTDVYLHLETDDLNSSDSMARDSA